MSTIIYAYRLTMLPIYLGRPIYQSAASFYRIYSSATVYVTSDMVQIQTNQHISHTGIPGRGVEVKAIEVVKEMSLRDLVDAGSS
jgi:hypothetical protein